MSKLESNTAAKKAEQTRLIACWLAHNFGIVRNPADWWEERASELLKTLDRGSITNG